MTPYVVYTLVFEGSDVNGKGDLLATALEPCQTIISVTRTAVDYGAWPVQHQTCGYITTHWVSGAFLPTYSVWWQEAAYLRRSAPAVS